MRASPTHGRGVFATRTIRKGARILEYRGKRITGADADARPPSHPTDNYHTLQFELDDGTVIDASQSGNAARFINHGCDPNCESVTEDRRIFIDAIATIQPGEELKYDYSIRRDKDDPPNIDEIYACRCGGKDCRGTMLWPPKRPKPRAGKRR